MEIHFKVIPNEEQRYATIGDYYLKDGVWEFRVSDMKNNDYEFLVLIHELTEWYLTQKRGITEESITEFDEKFEALREMEPEIIGDQEPGHMVSAPYHNEHVFAEKIEKQVAEELNVDWKAYDDSVSAL